MSFSRAINVLRLPKTLNSSGRAFHGVGAAAKNALSPVMFLVFWADRAVSVLYLITGYNLTVA